MIVPQRPEALERLDERIKENLEAGDWGPPTDLSLRFIPTQAAVDNEPDEDD